MKGGSVAWQQVGGGSKWEAAGASIYHTAATSSLLLLSSDFSCTALVPPRLYPVPPSTSLYLHAST